MFCPLFTVVNVMKQYCSGRVGCNNTELLTTLNNVGSKSLFNPVRNNIVTSFSFYVVYPRTDVTQTLFWFLHRNGGNT